MPFRIRPNSLHQPTQPDKKIVQLPTLANDITPQTGQTCISKTTQYTAYRLKPPAPAGNPCGLARITPNPYSLIPSLPNNPSPGLPSAPLLRYINNETPSPAFATAQTPKPAPNRSKWPLFRTKTGRI